MKDKHNNIWLIILLFFFLSIPLYAQETAVETAEEPEEQTASEEVTEETTTEIAEEEEEEEELPPEPTSRLSSSERQRIEMELKTSTLGELAVWSRTLGLSEGGTREDLSARIREHFGIREPQERSSGSRQKTLTIESAQTTEYFTIEATDEDYARLRGDVFIILKDGDNTHRIRAEEILFNRTRNILTARGGVTYEKTGSDKTETFRGENITVNIDNWASVFLDGSSTMESDGTSYLFSGLVISRTDQDVTILRNAKITSTLDDEAYWSISASRLWLLPGSDFVIFNALLNVGNIPVLYIPFFFFPTDQLVFHPVIGYRTREGGYFQTTTYILGQPKADASQTSSLGRILGNSGDSQLEREGLFLRSTGKKVVNPNETSLKLMIDYYVNLGAYIGIDLTTPKTGILDPLSLTLGMGLTRTVSFVNGFYTPYAPDYDGTFDYNHSNLFLLPVPFRYKFNLNSAVSGKFGRISWNLPYYSDPFIDSDFSNRAESMDWVEMLQQGAAVEEADVTGTEIGSYNWNISGNINQAFTMFAPYISRMSINTISTTLFFEKRDSRPVDGAGVPIPVNNQDPGRSFYAPDKWTIASVSGSITGAPLSLGNPTSRPATPAAAAALEQPRNPLTGIGIPISPWPVTETDEEESSSSDILAPPALRQTFTLPTKGNLRFNIDYSISPTFASELQFLKSNWAVYEDVNWDVQSTLWNFGTNASVNFRTDHSSGVFSNSLSFTGGIILRDYFHINDEFFADNTAITDVEEEKLKMRRQQFSQSNYQSSFNYNTRVQPFFANEIFRQTNLTHSLRGTLVRSKRYKEGESDPERPELTPQWVTFTSNFPWFAKEETVDGEFIPGLNSHSLTANLAANIMDKSQSISVSANLPPLDEMISTSASFRFWISETNISFRLEKLTETSVRPFENEGYAEGDWYFRPIDIRETLRFDKVGSFVLNMTLEPEKDYELTSLRAALSLWDLRVNYFANKVIRSEFIPVDSERPYLGGAWRQDSTQEPELLPRELSIAYSKTFPNIVIIKNRIGLDFNINTSVTYNLQQYTNSNFQITTGFTLKVAGFLDLSLSATSNNAVIWRYFKDVPGMEDLTFMYIDGPQNNVFTDLFDSFNFSDVTKRERSGFKMQRFNLNAVHYLGDWTATLSIGMYPYQDTTSFPPKYTITSDVSFMVQWKPITEIKANIRYDGKEERWLVE